MSPDVASARPLLDKLGVKPGAKVAVVDLDDPGFMKLLLERTSDIVQGKPRTAATRGSPSPAPPPTARDRT